MTSALLLLAAWAAAGDAGAALKNLEQAWELGVGQVTLPAVPGGSVTVRRCPACAPESLRVDARTEYRLRPGTGNVTLDALRREAARVANRPRTSLFVYFDPRTGVVRRLVLDTTQ